MFNASNIAENDEFFMRKALEFAVKAAEEGEVPIGAIAVLDGKIISGAGNRVEQKKTVLAHAEITAINKASKKIGDWRLEDCTLYVTLEPCSKVGRVGACTDAIASAGISRVVYVIADPNPKNRGRAKRVLAKRGIKCEQFKGDKEVIAQCEGLIKTFRKHVLTGLPYVTVKLAMSLDGKICDNKGDSNWISSKASRDFTNQFRERVDAIMVGAETVRKDNPSLLARRHPNKDLIRVVISKSGKIPKNAQIFTDNKNLTLVFNDAKKALAELGKMGITSVLCEGGLNLARYLAEEDLVDEWLTITAPVIIGNKPISKALHGITMSNKSFLFKGDSFFNVALSRFSKSIVF